MGMHYHIKGYGEQRVINAVMQRFDQRQAWARLIAALYWAESWTEDEG